MQQAIHILKKDVHFLWREILLIFALSSLLLLFGGHQGTDASDGLGLLFLIAAEFVIARLVQAEALPGGNQFWITRPYRWQSLLAAKVLFIVAFLGTPILLGQCGVLLRYGFSVGSILPGLLWTQVLFLVCFALPCAVLASLTESIASFIACALGIALLALALMWVNPWIRIATPAEMEWLRDSIGVVALLILAPPLLYFQYKTRRTKLTAAVAIGVVAAGAAGYLMFRWQMLFPIQAMLSKVTSDVRLVQRAKTPDEQKGPVGIWMESATQVNLSLPFTITGLPDDVNPQIESFSARLRAPNGRTMRFTNVHVGKARSFYAGASRGAGGIGPIEEPRKWNLTGDGLLDPAFADAARGQALTMTARFYLTVFGNARMRTIQLSKRRTDALDGLRCFAGYLNQLQCESAFRWPARIVSQRSGSGNTPLTRLISYSPFPASFDLDPIVGSGTAYYSRDPLPAERPVTIEVVEPLAYLQRDLAVGDLRLR